MENLSIQNTLIKGVDAHKSGRLTDAEQYYRAILKADPAHSDANHNMGVLATNLGKTNEALVYFKKALSENKVTFQHWKSYIEALLVAKLTSEARAVITQAQKLSFNTTEQRELLVFRSKVSSVSNLQYDFQYLIDINPPGTTLDTLVKLSATANYQKFLKEIQTLISEYPGSSHLYNFQGAANQQLHRLSEAVESFQIALKIRPDFYQAYFNLGVVFEQNKNTDRAIQCYQRAASIHPRHFNANYNLAKLLYEQGKKLEAVEFFKAAITIQSDHLDVLNYLGNAYKELGRFSEAIQVYQDGLELNPSSAILLHNMGTALKEDNRLDEAIESYRSAIEIKPDFPVAYFNLGNALELQGEVKSALECFTRATELDPNYAKAWNNKGTVLHKLKKMSDAIKAYERAIDIDPSFALAFNNLGNTFKELKQYSKAVQAYEAALRLSPSNANAKHMLASIKGNVTEQMPLAYVEDLFDGYASNFEASLVGDLEYIIPKKVAELLCLKNKSKTLGSVLDIGCGTGLFGLEMKHKCSKLEGIDISEKMLEQARAKAIYDKLIKSDIVSYLSQNKLNFDYIVALDVFIYVGDLSDIFKLIKLNSEVPGKLVFSTEHTDNKHYYLQNTGRYAHSKAYVEEMCTLFGYKLSHFSLTDLRKQSGQFLTAGIYIVDF